MYMEQCAQTCDRTSKFSRTKKVDFTDPVPTRSVTSVSILYRRLHPSSANNPPGVVPSPSSGLTLSYNEGTVICIIPPLSCTS